MCKLGFNYQRVNIQFLRQQRARRGPEAMHALHVRAISQRQQRRPKGVVAGGFVVAAFTMKAQRTLPGNGL